MNSIQPGDRLDHYAIDSAVAESGMAAIFRARDTRTGEVVAIKVPHADVESDPVLFDRFRREKEIGQRLRHPAIRRVFADDAPSRVYMAMEWVDGKLLRTILQEQGRLPVERAVRIAAEICGALEYIHANGVAHRDLKPENIMLDAEDRVKLIDFGIAASSGARRLTFANFSQTMGTPEYISPEQVRGKRGDGRSDLYALGVIFYEMLTGKTPFAGPNPFAVMNDRLLNYPRPPRELNPEISPQLQEIVYRALERDPRNRYRSARDFLRDLERQDQVGVPDRPEVRGWKKRRSPQVRMALLYCGLALLVVLIFGLMLLAARHR
jgi:serine/threonine protein kinase